MATWAAWSSRVATVGRHADSAAAVHWGWGVPVGLGLGWYYGDSTEEMLASGALMTPWGQRAVRYSGKQAWKGASWVARTNAVRTASTMAMRGTAAVAIPIAAGYAISYAIAGKSGASDFHDYITGGVSPQKWWDTVTLKSMR